LHFRDNLISGEKFSQRHADPEWGEKLIVGLWDDKRDLVTNERPGFPGWRRITGYKECAKPEVSPESDGGTREACPFICGIGIVPMNPRNIGRKPKPLSVLVICNSDGATVTSAHRTCRSWREPRDYRGRICFCQNAGGDDLSASQPSDIQPPSPVPG